MRAKKMTAQQTVKVLGAFYDEYGPEQMKLSFGWKHAPETVQRGKRYYAFGVDDDAVGWGGLYLNVQDATDTEAYLTVGVFKNHQRKGYRRLILRWLAEKALELGADAVCILVYKANTEQYDRTIRESEDLDAEWVHIGEIWAPTEWALGFFAYRPLASLVQAEPIEPPGALPRSIADVESDATETLS